MRPRHIRLLLVAFFTLSAMRLATADPPTGEQKRDPRPAGEARTDRFGDPLPAGASARLGTVRFRQGGPVLCVRFAPDGKAVVSGSDDGLIRVWEPASG